jgi:hypothetical protein
MAEITIKIDEDNQRGFEALIERFGSAASAVNSLIRQAVTDSDKKYDEYFNPCNLSKLASSEGEFEKGDFLTVSIDELIAMETGPVPQRIIGRMQELGWSTEGINQ